MKKIYSLIFISSFLLSGSSFAQKEGNIWCFGQGAGLDFNSGSPVFFPGVAMNQWEGVTSIANSNGQLLFYSDGITCWNRNHVPMPNGTGLMSNASSTQAGLIVKQPGANPYYYLFTVPQLYYSIIDTTLQGGLGDITTKNVLMYPTYDERLTACMHANGTDVWILASSNGGDSIVSFLLTSTGISGAPIVTATGFSALNSIGYMKTSPTGDHLAMAFYGIDGPYELFDFDIATGTISNPVLLDSTVYANAYGLEFSPDGTKLYGANHGGGYFVFQFDLNAGSAAAIKASATLVGTASHGYAAELQLAPDGKIYLSQWTSNVLGRFDNPNGLGLASSYDDNAFTLPSGITNGGLPNLRGGLFTQTAPVAIFSAPNHICPGTCTNFTNHSTSGTSFLWSFAGANPSTSTDVDPQNICYNAPGTYAVSLIATNANGSDTLTLNNYITVYPYPAPQGIAQSGDSLIANQGAVSYQWYHNGVLIPGATNYFYVQSEGGDFNVVATDANGCEVEAVIFDVPMGIAFEVSDLKFEVYPNPVEDKLEVRSSSASGGGTTAVEISICNLLGEKIFEMQPHQLKTTQPIDVSNLPQGMYWIEISSDKKFFHTKFVKQ